MPITLNAYNFECQEYDVIPLGRQEINKSDTEVFNRINEHCISFRENGNCETVITNYTATEVKEMLSGKKKINTDVLGYLK